MALNANINYLFDCFFVTLTLLGVSQTTFTNSALSNDSPGLIVDTESDMF